MPTRRRGRPLSSLDPKRNLPKAGYYRKDPSTNINILAIFFDSLDGSVFIIPHKDEENKEEIFTAELSTLRTVATGSSVVTALTPKEAEQLIAIYGENTKGKWVDGKALNSWFYTYRLEDYIFDGSIAPLEEILTNLNREVK